MEEDPSFSLNAAASYGEIEAAGPPASPLPFEQHAIVGGPAERVTAWVFDPATQDTMEVRDIIYEKQKDGNPPDRAYGIGKKILDCLLGAIKECTILRFRKDDTNVPWEVTGQKAIVKILSWERAESCHLMEIRDPRQEAAALQYISQNGAHEEEDVIGACDILEDEKNIFTFMPFSSSGDLFDLILKTGRFSESKARSWFKQILLVSPGCFDDVTL